jgi:DNA-binding transcriptional regulator YiaG
MSGFKMVYGAIETETFEEAKRRVLESIGGAELDRHRQDGHVRSDAILRVRTPAIVNPSEFAAIYGMGRRAAERWISGERRPPFPLVGAVVRLGERLTFLNLDALGGAWWESLSPSQREQVEQILRIPLGETRHGGRSADTEALQAAVAATPAAAPA